MGKNRHIWILTGLLAAGLVFAGAKGMSAVHAAEETAVDGIHFPDSAFQSYISAEIDSDQSGTLSEEEILAVTEMDFLNYPQLQSLEGIEKFVNLQALNVADTSVASLDVSGNPALERLLCQNNPGLVSLKFGSGSSLKAVNCSNTGITKLDLSQLPALEYLACENTKIKELDTSSNSSLRTLFCSNAGLTRLDLKQNRMLSELQCTGTPLLYLDLPDSGTASVLLPEKTAPELDVTGDFFDLTAAIPGIQADKVSEVSNGVKEGSMIRDYQAGKALEYIYDCGQGHKLKVSLQLSIENVWKTELSVGSEFFYGDPLTPSAQPAFGEVSYLYSDREQSGFSAREPETAGTWYVKAVVNEDKNYSGLESAAREFRIVQASNTWKTELSMGNWTYGKKPASPAAEAKFGTVKYLYSDAPQGVFTEDKPSEAGIWYVKARVEETGNYTGLESQPVQFEIEKGTAPAVQLPKELKAVHGDLLADISLPEGWSWVNENERVSADKTGYQAKLKVDDKNYDYQNTEGYDPLEHSVERTVTVQVDKAERSLSLSAGKGLDKVYDGEPVDISLLQADPDKGGGKVSYLWEESGNGVWTLLGSAPENAGIYRVTAVIEADNYYREAKSAPIEFEIQRAAAPELSLPGNLSGTEGEKLSSVVLPAGWSWSDPEALIHAEQKGYPAKAEIDDRNYNYDSVEGYLPDEHSVIRELTVDISVWKNVWLTEPDITGWTYGDAPKKPSGMSKYGKTVYLYSADPSGGFTDKIPEEAGTWYLKAVAEAGVDYTSLQSSPKAFVIRPKQIYGQIMIPEIHQDTDLGRLELWDGDKILVQGKDYVITGERTEREVTVTFTFQGNYSGTVTRTYLLEADMDSENTEQENQPGSGDSSGEGNASETEDTSAEEKPEAPEGLESLESPDTGDNTETGRWLLAMALAVLGLLMLSAAAAGRKKWR